MKPRLAILIANDELCRLLSILPVSAADLVSSNAEFASDADWDDAILMIHNLDARMW